MTREFKCCAGWNCCAACDACAMEISVEAPVGQVIGYVKQQSVTFDACCVRSVSDNFHIVAEFLLHCVSKNDTDVALYNFDTDQPVIINFGRDVTERVCYQMVISYPTSHN